MGRDLGTDDLFPSCTDLMRLGDASEAQITENLTEQITDGSRRPFATTGSRTHAPVPRPSRWSRNTIPVGTYG